MICELRNWLEKYSCWITEEDCCWCVPVEETDLFTVIYYVLLSICVTLVIAWWIIPMRYIYHKMKDMKFRCDK